jgi:hypothetical protein
MGTHSGTSRRLSAERGANPEHLVRAAMDDVAVIVGSAVAIQALDTDQVWSIINRLDRIRIRLLRDIKGSTPADGSTAITPVPPRLHTAVEDFIARNRAGADE